MSSCSGNNTFDTLCCRTWTITMADGCYETGLYNAARTHLSLNKDAPSPRTVHSVGRILPTPFLGGLHHLHVRV
jgi:hypothetical protein